MALNEFPCTSHHCKSQKEQLAMLVTLLATKLGAGTLAQLEEATKTYRGMTEAQMLEYQIAAFTAEEVAAATPAALACDCYSEQKLREMLTYLQGTLIGSV